MKPDKELLQLATELIQRKAKPFDAKAFKNQYDLALRELIEAKVEHRKPQPIEEPQLGAKVINLMDALKKSIGATSTRPARQPEQEPRPSAARRRPGRAPRRRARPLRKVKRTRAAPAVRSGNSDGGGRAVTPVYFRNAVGDLTPAWPTASETYRQKRDFKEDRRARGRRPTRGRPAI